MSRKRKSPQHHDNNLLTPISRSSGTAKKLKNCFSQWSGFDNDRENSVHDQSIPFPSLSPSARLTPSTAHSPTPQHSPCTPDLPSPSPSPFPAPSSVSSTSCASENHTATFLQIIHSPSLLDTVLATLVETYLLPDGNFAPPRHIWLNMQKFRPYVEEGAKALSGKPTYLSKENGVARRKKVREGEMSYHAAKFWGHMRYLGIPLLLQLPEEYAIALNRSPEMFFTDGNHGMSLSVDGVGGAREVYMYSRRIGSRIVADKVRRAVLTLAWHRVIEAVKTSRMAESGSRVKLNAKAKPRLTEMDLDGFYERCFSDSSCSVGGGGFDPSGEEMQKQEVLTWFNALRHTGSAYAFLASEVGYGALVHLLPHFSESAVVQGLSRSSVAAREGVAWLKGEREGRGSVEQNGEDEEGLVRDEGVRKVGEQVERLVDWIERKILGGEGR